MHLIFLEEKKRRTGWGELSVLKERVYLDDNKNLGMAQHFSRRDVKALCKGTLPPYLYLKNEDKTQKRFAKVIQKVKSKIREPETFSNTSTAHVREYFGILQILLATNHPRKNFVQENKPDLDICIFNCLHKILVCIRPFQSGVEAKFNIIKQFQMQMPFCPKAYPKQYALPATSRK